MLETVKRQTQPRCPMKTRAHLSCTLSCPWRATGQCLAEHVGENVLGCGRLSLGQLAGLRSLYHPFALPPCVRADGRLSFDEEKVAVSLRETSLALHLL